MISTNYTNKINITRKIYAIAGAILTLAFPYFIMVYNIGEPLEAKQSLCPFKMLSGFPCPGCGITKSLICVYEGNIYKSLYYHLFGPLTFAFCVAVIVLLSAELITKKEYFRNIFYSRKLAYFLGISLAIYHTIRLVYFLHSNTFDEILRQSIWK